MTIKVVSEIVLNKIHTQKQTILLNSIHTAHYFKNTFVRTYLGVFFKKSSCLQHQSSCFHRHRMPTVN